MRLKNHKPENNDVLCSCASSYLIMWDGVLAFSGNALYFYLTNLLKGTITNA